MSYSGDVVRYLCDERDEWRGVDPRPRFRMPEAFFAPPAKSPMQTLLNDELFRMHKLQREAYEAAGLVGCVVEVNMARSEYLPREPGMLYRMLRNVDTGEDWLEKSGWRVKPGCYEWSIVLIPMSLEAFNRFRRTEAAIFKEHDMTVHFTMDGGKRVVRHSMPCIPPVGSFIRIDDTVYEVWRLEFFTTPNGIECAAELKPAARAGATQEAGEPKVQTGKQTKGK